MDVRIRGAEQLGDLSKRLRAAGEEGKGLRRELIKALNSASKPLRQQAQAAARSQLPQSGGLAAIVAKPKGTVSVRAGRDPSVTIIRKGKGISTDAGSIRHPTFGDRRAWVNQPVKGAGWFSKTLADGAPAVRKELLDAMTTVANQITKG